MDVRCAATRAETLHGVGMSAHLPPAIGSRVFDLGGGTTTSQLNEWGLSSGKIDRLVRDGQLVRVARGCYRLPSTAGDDYWAELRSDHLKSMAAQITPDAVAGFRTAALLWDLPVSDMPPHPEVIRPPRSHRPRGLRTVCTALSMQDVVTVNGIAVTTMARTAVDIAADLPIPQALVTLDAALRNGVRRELMTEIVQRRGAFAGVANARQAIEWADPFAESPVESRGRGELLIRGVPRPECNLTFCFQGEEFRPDAYWKGTGLTGEADGRGKYDRERWVEDPLWAERLRHQWFEDEVGMKVFRWIDREMRHSPDAATARWRRLAARPEVRLWVPPTGLEIVRRPLLRRYES